MADVTAGLRIDCGEQRTHDRTRQAQRQPPMGSIRVPPALARSPEYTGRAIVHWNMDLPISAAATSTILPDNRTGVIPQVFCPSVYSVEAPQSKIEPVRAERSMRPCYQRNRKNTQYVRFCGGAELDPNVSAFVSWRPPGAAADSPTTRSRVRGTLILLPSSRATIIFQSQNFSKKFFLESATCRKDRQFLGIAGVSMKHEQTRFGKLRETHSLACHPPRLTCGSAGALRGQP